MYSWPCYAGHSMDAFLFGSAVTPSVLLVWFFHRRDLYPEPGRVLWATFALGVLTVVPVLWVVGPYNQAIESIPDPITMALASAFLAAAVPEEFFKFLVVVFYCARHKEFEEPMDGIVYGVVASLGFATLENILYVADGGYGLALMRALTAVPGHALTGAIMGYFVGQAKFGTSGQARNWALAYLAPTLLHGLYDFPLMAVSAASAETGKPGWVAYLLLLVVAVLIFEWIFSVRALRRLRREQDANHPHRLAEVAKVDHVDPPIPPKEVVAALAHPTTMGSKIIGVFYLIFGVVLASFGGLMTIGFALGLAEDGITEGLGATIIALLVAALLPLVLGLLLFRAGLRRVNGETK